MSSRISLSAYIIPITPLSSHLAPQSLRIFSPIYSGALKENLDTLFCGMFAINFAIVLIQIGLLAFMEVALKDVTNCFGSQKQKGLSGECEGESQHD